MILFLVIRFCYPCFYFLSLLISELLQFDKGVGSAPWSVDQPHWSCPQEDNRESEMSLYFDWCGNWIWELHYTVRHRHVVLLLGWSKISGLVPHDANKVISLYPSNIDWLSPAVSWFPFFCLKKLRKHFFVSWLPKYCPFLISVEFQCIFHGYKFTFASIFILFEKTNALFGFCLLPGG